MEALNIMYQSGSIAEMAGVCAFQSALSLIWIEHPLVPSSYMHILFGRSMESCCELCVATCYTPYVNT